MNGQPRAAEWEYLVEGDLAPHLVPSGRPGRPSSAAGAPRLPEGAREGIAANLGPVRPADLLLVPAAAWPLGGWRRHCLYSPLCVAAIGQEGAGLWVRDLPLPQVRAQVALGDVALIEHRTAGWWHALTVTARSGALVVRYGEDQRAPVDAWTRRLRLRVAAPGNEVSQAHDALLLAPDDGSAVGRSGGGLRRRCLLTVTSRELIIEQSWRDRRHPWRQISRTLYLPRQSASGTAVRGSTLRLESADTAVRVRLTSRKAVAAAWTWLESSSAVRGLTPPEGVTGSASD